jgi:hypothetical protein
MNFAQITLRMLALRAAYFSIFITDEFKDAGTVFSIAV